MFAHRKTDRNAFYRAVAAALFTFLLAAAPPLWAACETASAVTLSSTYRGNGYELLKVTTSSDGILTLDVSAAGAAVQPKVTFLGTSCTSAAGEGTAWDYVQQNPAAVVVDVYSSGTYYFEAEPQDSQQTLGDFKMRAAWVADPSTPDEENTLGSDATDTCTSSSTLLSSSNFDQDRFVTATDDIDQWDSDILRGLSYGPGVVVIDMIDTNSTSVTATFYEGTDCGTGDQLAQGTLTASSGRLTSVVYNGDHNLAVDPYMSGSGTYEVAVRHFAPCGLGETDDHSDAPLCATEISVGGNDTGQVDNTSSDDEDYFTFVLSAQDTIEMKTTGSTDTYGSVYDDSGQRLETDDNDGTDSNFLISRTLGAGRYFVRVEGASSAEGSYTLYVSSVP